MCSNSAKQSVQIKKSAPTKVDAPKNAQLMFATTQIIRHMTRNAQIENAFFAKMKNILLKYTLFDLCGINVLTHIFLIVNIYGHNDWENIK